MRAGRTVGAAAALLCLTVIVASAVQSRDSSPSGPPAYRVTNWPPNKAGQPYSELVEDYLNSMAASGWRLQGKLVKDGANMLVFERTASRH